MNSTNNTSILADVDTQLHITIIRAMFIYCLLVHIAYLLLVFMCFELRAKHYLFVNHAVFANSMLILAAFVTSFIAPKKSFESFVPIVCPIFEVYWPFSIYLRSYSIVLIAIHRYIAVFRTNLFHRINSSTLFYMSGILAVWAISLGLSFINKFMFKTTYSLFYCTDGFSLSKLNRLFYSISTIYFAVILPSLVIVTIYVKIIRKLRKTREKLDELHESSPARSSVSFARRFSSLVPTILFGQREAKFADQFIFMLIVVVFLFCGMIFLSMKNIWPSYFSSLNWLFTAVRCFTGIVATFIPIFSVYFNPSRERILRF